MKDKIRCSWCSNDQLYKNYHDIEWGVPISDDNKLKIMDKISLEDKNIKT